jgi:phosphoesterase RecJ-like protein
MKTLSSRDFQEAAALIGGWRRPVLITHEKPDGDALGSLVAMRSMLRRRGVEADAILFEAIPDRYALFRDHGSLRILGRDRTLDDLSRCDGIIVLDTCAFQQLRPIADWLRSATQPKLAVDHHVTRDEMADTYLIDESAAATCLILHDWAGAMGWTMERVAAQALFVGLAMDTGWFHHSNTDARAFSAAAALVGLGVQPHVLYESLFHRDSVARVRLLGVALEAMEISANGQMAVTTLDAAAFAAAGATSADTEDIVNEPLRIATVKVSVLLVDQGDGVIRVSLRSRAGEREGEDIDVAAVAQSLGGGGHRLAAGAKVTAGLEQVHDRLVQSLAPLLGT